MKLLIHSQMSAVRATFEILVWIEHLQKMWWLTDIIKVNTHWLKGPEYVFYINGFPIH